MSEGVGQAVAAFAPMLEGDERIIWTWTEMPAAVPLLTNYWRLDGGFVSTRAKRVLQALSVFFVLVFVWASGDRAGERGPWFLGFFLLLAIVNIYIVAAPARLRKAVNRRLSFARDDWAVSGVGTRHGLTQYRLLSTRDGVHSTVSLEPGEPTIQYGKFRVDRPNARGRPLIEHIPMPEQHRLFAALKEARRIREAEATARNGEVTAHA